MEKYVILGVGNGDRGDDAVGPRAAEILAKDENLLKIGAFVSPHSGEGASLMDIWQGAKLAVIIDAMKSGAPAGTVRRFDVNEEKLGGGMFYYSSHLFSLAEAVEMARLLKRLPEKLVIYGIEGESYAFGAGFPRGVQDALPKVIESVKREFSNSGGVDA